MSLNISDIKNEENIFFLACISSCKNHLVKHFLIECVNRPFQCSVGTLKPSVKLQELRLFKDFICFLSDIFFIISVRLSLISSLPMPDNHKPGITED